MITVRTSPSSGRCCCPGDLSPSHALQQQWVFCYGGTPLQKSSPFGGGGERARGMSSLRSAVTASEGLAGSS
jgi:hypothetical protein